MLTNETTHRVAGTAGGAGVPSSALRAPYHPQAPGGVCWTRVESVKKTISSARREDMRRLLRATDGKVFALTATHLLTGRTRIRGYRSRGALLHE